VVIPAFEENGAARSACPLTCHARRDRCRGKEMITFGEDPAGMK
jgi:hypothetical protein